MDKLNIDNYKNNNLEMSLKKDYIEALKNEDFKKLVVSLKIISSIFSISSFLQITLILYAGRFFFIKTGV